MKRSGNFEWSLFENNSSSDFLGLFLNVIVDDSEDALLELDDVDGVFEYEATYGWSVKQSSWRACQRLKSSKVLLKEAIEIKKKFSIKK